MQKDEWSAVENKERAGGAARTGTSGSFKRLPFYLFYGLILLCVAVEVFWTPWRDLRMLFASVPLFLLVRLADKRRMETEGRG